MNARLPHSASACALVASAAAIVGSVLACRQLVGITDNPPEDLVTSICGLPYGTNVCASCVNANCCAQSNTCAADPVCSAYESCLGTCNGDPRCRSQCTVDNPVGAASDVPALSACMASKCEAECGLTCGGIAELISQPDAAAECQQCLLASSACSQAEACGSSEECNAYERCTTPFLSVDTHEVCEGLTDAGYPTDAATALASSTTFASSCATGCATGDDWACVGHVSWLDPKGPTCTIGCNPVKDYVTGDPVDGALVSVCSPTDQHCEQPLTYGTTDENGRVSLTFQSTTDTGGHGLNGFLRVTSPTTVPIDQYWGFPLVETHAYFLAEVITPTELQDQWDALNVTSDPTRGTVSVVVYDCRYAAAPAVKVTLSTADALTQGFSSKGLAATTTDQTGLLVFANVPAGLLQVTATPIALERPASQVTVTVQPATVTNVLMFPTPSP